MDFDDASTASAGDHLEAMDALHRFGAGVDHGDARLLASVFSDDAVVDFSPCGQTMGLEFPLLTGGAAIASFLGATARTQMTTHVVTNGRVHLDGDVARLRALVGATHLPKDDHSRRCEMMNWYEVELVKQAGLWRIRHLVIKNAWFTGDPRVLLGR